MNIAILSNGNANYSTLRLKEEAEKRGHHAVDRKSVVRERV